MVAIIAEVMAVAAPMGTLSQEEASYRLSPSYRHVLFAKFIHFHCHSHVSMYRAFVDWLQIQSVSATIHRALYRKHVQSLPLP